MEKAFCFVCVGAVIIIALAVVFGIITKIFCNRRTTSEAGAELDRAAEIIADAERTNSELERRTEESQSIIDEIRKQKIDD